MGGYLFLTLAASFLLRRLEKKLQGTSNYELVNTDQLVMTAGNYSFAGSAPYEEKSRDYPGGRHE